MAEQREPKPYARDLRSPPPANETVSKYMRANKSKDTKPELKLRKALWAAGIRGYRIHWKKAPGKPDIAFPGRKIAIFMHGCYWHRCPICKLSQPKHNADFWKAKFARNQERDLQHRQSLTEAGWKVLVLWECEVKKDIETCLERVRILLNT